MGIDYTVTLEKKLAHISIVLKETAFPGNIGSTARAMKNMGITDLRLINPPRDRREEARALASSAKDLLETATTYRSVAEAVADCQIVVGTTARLGGWRKKVWTPRDIATEFIPDLAPNRMAIVFGPEDRGLVNEDIHLCTHLVRIPTSHLMSSLNLSQAVMVLAYEFYSGLLYHLDEDSSRKAPKYADHKTMEGMFDHLERALHAIEYFSAGNSEYFMLDIRRILNRAKLANGEVALFRGLCRQMLWSAENGTDKKFRRWFEGVEHGLHDPE